MSIEVTIAKSIRRKIPQTVIEKMASALTTGRLRPWHVYISQIQPPVPPGRPGRNRVYDSWDIFGTFDDEDGVNYSFGVTYILQYGTYHEKPIVQIDRVEERENPRRRRNPSTTLRNRPRVSPSTKLRDHKTVKEWTIQGHYGRGWEDVSAYDNRTDARADLKAYNENERQYAHRLIMRRVPRENPGRGGLLDLSVTRTREGAYLVAAMVNGYREKLIVYGNKRDAIQEFRKRYKV